MNDSCMEKPLIRLLRQLVKADAKGAYVRQSNAKSKLTCAGAIVTFDNEIILGAVSEGLVNSTDERLTISQTGKARLRRFLCDHDPFLGQHQNLKTTTVDHQGARKTVVENCAESPLARLYARKLKDGSRYLSSYEYEAGNRLRRDFEKSHMQASISASWHEGVSTGGKSRGGMHSYELSEMAMDARDRLQKALDAIGPELAGVTLDICCFLKGFETVEMERRWPNRSAKLMLKTALTSLARHYGYLTSKTSGDTKNKANISHWGVENYRPSI